MKDFFSTIKGNQIFHSIDGKTVLSESKIYHLIQESIQYSSAYSLPSFRLILLLQKDHQQFWHTASDFLKKRNPIQSNEVNRELEHLKTKFATILCFYDSSIIEYSVSSFPAYRKQFFTLAQQEIKNFEMQMLHYLQQNGLNGSLHTLHSTLQFDWKKTWMIPETWIPTAQISLGKPDSDYRNIHSCQNLVEIYRPDVF